MLYVGHICVYVYVCVCIYVPWHWKPCLPKPLQQQEIKEINTCGLIKLFNIFNRRQPKKCAVYTENVLQSYESDGFLLRFFVLPIKIRMEINW